MQFDDKPDNQNENQQVIYINVTTVLQALVLFFGALFFMMSLNSRWISFVREEMATSAQDFVFLLPKESFLTTLIWVVSLLFNAGIIARLFMRHKYVSGSLLLAGHSFFGYALMYFVPLTSCYIFAKFIRFFDRLAPTKKNGEQNDQDGTDSHTAN